jgi:hypothetical protein
MFDFVRAILASILPATYRRYGSNSLEIRTSTLSPISFGWMLYFQHNRHPIKNASFQFKTFPRDEDFRSPRIVAKISHIQLQVGKIVACGKKYFPLRFDSSPTS